MCLESLFWSINWFFSSKTTTIIQKYVKLSQAHPSNVIDSSPCGTVKDGNVWTARPNQDINEIVSREDIGI